MPMINPYTWASSDQPAASRVDVTALRIPGAEVRVSNGITFMGIVLTAEQAVEMGAVLTKFGRSTPDSRTE